VARSARTRRIARVTQRQPCRPPGRILRLQAPWNAPADDGPGGALYPDRPVACRGRQRAHGAGDDWCASVAFKGYMDGSAGSRTAYFFEPFSDSAATTA